MAVIRNMEGLMKDAEYNHRIQHAQETAKKAQWNYWHQDYPVLKELKELIDGIEKAMPHVKFYPAEFQRKEVEVITEDRQRNTVRTYVVKEFSVYMDEYPYDLGRVGYDEYVVKSSKHYSNVNPNLMYGIYSRKIANTKYGTDRKFFNMVTTKDINKAVKMAKTYILPYTHKELATVSYKPFKRKVDHRRNATINKLFHLVSPIMGTLPTTLVADEMLNLISQGVIFKSDVYKEIAKDLPQVYAEVMEEKNRNVYGQFVRVRTVGEDNYVDVIEVTAMNLHLNDDNPDFNNMATYPNAEIPEDILGSIAVLSILEYGQYVPNVGFKVDSKSFWIEKG